MKNIKKILASSKDKVLCSEKIKDNIKVKLGYVDIDKQNIIVNGSDTITATGAKQHKKILCIGVAVLVFMFTFGIFIHFLINTRKDLPTQENVNKFIQITDANSFYAYSTASIGAILSSVDVQTGSVNVVNEHKLSSKMVARMTLQSEKSKTSGECFDQIKTINQYMPLVEGMLSDKKIENESIPKEYGYEFGMQVKYFNLYGEKISYKLFYDKIFIDEESDDGEIKTNYSIKGVLVIENTTYLVEGLYKIEIEEGEMESELYFRAFTSADKTSYIEVKQEYENEIETDETEIEHKYTYSIFKNKTMVEKTIFKYELENDELELEMLITKNGKTESVLFKGENKGGENALRIKVNKDGQSMTLYVHIRQDLYHYVFEDGTYLDFNRNSSGKNE